MTNPSTVLPSAAQIDVDLQAIAVLKEGVRSQLKRIFPDGSPVENKLREAQASWTAAVVLSASWASPGHVRVRLVNAARSGRFMVRDVPYKQVRARTWNAAGEIKG